MERFKLNDPLKQSKSASNIEGFIDDNECYICDSKKPKSDGRYYDITRVVDGKKKSMLLHRYVYETYNNCKIPENMVIRHKCDNYLCVNPNHLEVGTQQDNVNDSIKRGRKPKGEKASNSKLSNKDVLEIKKLLSEGKMSQAKIAEQFGVFQTMISHIKLGKHRS